MTGHAAGDDTAAQLTLRRHRRVATGSLVLAGAVYTGTHFVADPGYGVLLVRAGAEAGLIGGVADWFAVTALFRRPLGLPIPHTAIIPANRERLAVGLGRFMADHFLDPEVVSRRLGEAEPASRIGDWLAEPEHADTVARRLLALLPDVLDAFDDHEVRAFYGQAFEAEFTRLDLAPLAEAALRALRERGDQEWLVHRVTEAAMHWLRANRGRIRSEVRARSRWWIPRRVDERVADGVIDAMAEWLEELADPASDRRRDLDAAVESLLHDLRDSPGVRSRIDGLRDALLASPEAGALLDALWASLRRGLEGRLEAGDADLRATLARSLNRLGTTLQTDPDARARLDRRLEGVLRELVLPGRASIGGFIADVIRDWPTESLVQRLELAVGRDLQFIRINGTLVGALVGMVLFVVTGLVFGH